MRFRKKPVVIEAIECTAELGMLRDDITPRWLMEACKSGTVTFLLDKGIAIETMEGTMKADIGDWIIRGVQGELYPCKPDIFEQTYERVIE